MLSGTGVLLVFAQPTTWPSSVLASRVHPSLPHEIGVQQATAVQQPAEVDYAVVLQMSMTADANTSRLRHQGISPAVHTQYSAATIGSNTNRQQSLLTAPVR
jgi:hypothetical protein